MFVKPAKNTEVPDIEKGGLLPPEGREVEANSYWLKRVAEGDCIEAEPPKSAKPAAA